MLTVLGALIGSRAITISPIEVLIVAVYRLAGSIPISGGAENFCCLGAEPSRGGNGVDMRKTLPSSVGVPAAAADSMTGPQAWDAHLGARLAELTIVEPLDPAVAADTVDIIKEFG